MFTKLVFRCSIWKYLSRKHYHSKQGVYGYIPKPEEISKISPEIVQNRIVNCRVYNLANAYRTHGHKISAINPLLSERPRSLPELDPVLFGISNDSLSNEINLQGIVHELRGPPTIGSLIEHLQKTYCGTISVEFMHTETQDEKEWFSKRFEEIQTETLSLRIKQDLASCLLKSQVFDNYLATKFSTVKRYSGEGAESMMAFFMELFRNASINNISDMIVGMPHRGRLNLLAVLLDYRPVAIFRKMKGLSEFPVGSGATGDVLLHLATSVKLNSLGQELKVTLLPNPSHLEAVSPVIVGKARARLQSLKIGDYSDQLDSKTIDQVLAVQVHGDASFSGQGIVMETLAMSRLPHYEVGGSLHLVVNNQLGYTTPGDRGRSTLHCSDLVKMVHAPVIHVNGDYPEDVAKAAQLSLEYRCRFHKDILVDMVCFRKWGHNEMDDPTFTNPAMYKSIAARASVPDFYSETLVKEGVWTQEESNDVVSSYVSHLGEEFKQVDSYQPKPSNLMGRWEESVPSGSSVSTWDSGVPSDLLQFVGAKAVEIPDGFNLHQNLQRVLVSERRKRLVSGGPLDWALAESLAVGTLLLQGFNVRFSGQDVGRGTFSQRHVMLVDQKTNEMYIPFNNMLPGKQGMLEVANSLLSEEAVLGFEYGMSIESPKNLIIWEAQFGDFYNTAQVIFDTFISSGETKWLLQSGIVVLLPHGYDGAGPEHSSCHIERFLQMCDSKEDEIDGDNVNWQIVNPTTPAQYFHLLRAQDLKIYNFAIGTFVIQWLFSLMTTFMVIRNFRKPLVVASPKLLLRHPAAISTLSDLAPGTCFQPVLPDPAKLKPEDVKTVLICCGKHFYTLQKERDARNLKDVAILRLEALCPFPADEISKELLKYKNAQSYIWSQEEHQNMGAWFFVAPRFQNILHCQLKYVGRKPLGTAAVGIDVLHRQENKEILEKSFSL